MAERLRDRAPAWVEGSFSLVDGWRLQGWCFRAADPATRPVVAILVDGVEVARCTASERNDLLKAAGLGDGRYGFGLKVPGVVGEAADGEKSVEAMEVESGTLLGRVLFHAGRGISPDEHRLRDLQAAVAALHERVRAPAPQALRLGGALEAFGRGLGTERGWGMRPAVARVLPSGTPEVSIIFTKGSPGAIAAAAQHAGAVLRPRRVETLLLSHRSPEHALLVRTIPGLRLVDARSGFNLAINLAVKMADAPLLCVVGRAEDFLAFPVLDHPVHAARGPGADGISCLVPRVALIAAGGFPLIPSGIAWEALAALLGALDVRVVQP